MNSNLASERTSLRKPLRALEVCQNPEFTRSGFSLFRCPFRAITTQITTQAGRILAKVDGICAYQRFAKPSYSVKGYRGFESLPLRSNNQINQFMCFDAGTMRKTMFHELLSRNSGFIDTRLVCDELALEFSATTIFTVGRAQ